MPGVVRNRVRSRTAFFAKAALVLGAAVTAVALAASAQPPAHAQIPIVDDLLGRGLGETLGGLTCDPARQLEEPLGALGGAVSSLLCNVDQLDLTYYTVYRRPDGSTVTRETRALLGLPSLLNVDDDLRPDLPAWLVPRSTSQLTLRIDRGLLETSQLPVSIEVVAHDPTPGDLPRQRIAFGYDARGSRAPQSFQADIRIGESATQPGAATLGIQYTTTGAGTGLDVTGGVFDGTLAGRTDPVGTRLSYAPMPNRAGVELVIGRRLAMRLTANAPTLLTAAVEDVLGPQEIRARAVFDRLPEFVEVGYEPIATDRRTITYSAAAAVNRFTFDYTDRTAGAVNQAATVRATALPTALVLRQTGASAGTFEATTAGSSVGSIEVGYAQGGLPRLLAGATGPYGYLSDDGTVRSYAARLDGLRRASFDAGGTPQAPLPIVVDAELAGRTPFTVKVQRPDLTADGILADLPRHVRAEIDLAGGRLDYNGFGDTIDRIQVDATQATPFFEPVRRLQVTVRQLPPSVTATLLARPVVGGTQRKGVAIQASAPIGSIDAVLLSDPAGQVPPGLRPDRQGASIVDTTAGFAAAARITGLRSVNYLGATDTAPYELGIEHTAGPFDLRYEEDGSTIVGEVEDVPATANLSYAKGTGALHFDGSAGIGRIHLERVDAQPFAGDARLLRMTVRDVPQPLDLTLRTNGLPRKGIEALASAPLGSVDAVLLSDPAGQVPGGLRPGRQGASIVDNAAGFAAVARVMGLRSLRYLGPLAATATAPEAPYELGIVHDAGPFDLRYSEDGSTIVGEVEDVPATANLSYAKGTGKLHFDGSAGIGRVFLERRDAQPFVGGAKLLRVTIHGVPQPIDVALPRAGDTRTVVTASQPLGKIDFLLTSGPETPPGGDPNDTGESRLYARTADFTVPELTVSARVNGFKGLSFADNVLGFGDYGTELSLDLVAPQRFKAHADLNRAGDAVHTTGTIDLDVNRLPTHFDVRLTDTALRWRASAGIDSASLVAKNLPGDQDAGAPHFIDATLTRVPSSFRVGFGESDTGFTSDSEPIGEAEVNISDVNTTYPDRLPADRNTVRLVNADAGLSQARVRVFDVKRASVGTFIDNLSGRLEFGTAPRKPFDVFLDTARNVTGGTARQHAEIHVPQPPRKADVETTIGDKVAKLSYDAYGEGFPEIDLLTTTRKPRTSQSSAVDLTGIDVVVKDLPPKLTFCYTDQGQLAGVYCRHDAPDQYVVDPCLTCSRRLITQYNDATVSLDTTGATTRVRLEKLESCKGTDPTFGASCLNQGDRFDFLRIRNLLAKRFQFEYADSESVERDDDGDVIEDDLLKLYLDTDAEGINVERLEAWKHSRDKRTIVIANDLGDPVRGTRAFAANDTTPPPSLEAGSGTLQCDHIEIRTAVPILGTIDVEPLLPICD